MTNLNKNERELRAKMEAEERSAQPSKGIRESLYGHIKVSVRTMNIIVLFISFLLVTSIVIGVVQGGR